MSGECENVIKMDSTRNRGKGIARKKRKRCSEAEDAMTEFISYLKSHNLYFEKGCLDDTHHITMLFRNCENCPDSVIEGSIYFYQDYMAARVYYSENAAQICHESDNRQELYRVFNYLHAQCWPRVLDGVEGALYNSQYLYSPRFYITEGDECEYDITATILIPYSHYKQDILETNDYITAALPNLMNKLGVPIFSVLIGTMSADCAIMYIKSEVLK